VVVFITPTVVNHPSQAGRDIDAKVQESFKQRDLDRLREQVGKK
jgi:hypothetical protein